MSLAALPSPLALVATDATPATAAYVASLLDQETLATEALAGTMPQDSIGRSRIAWMGDPAYRAPVAAYAFLRDPIESGGMVYAWMMTTRLLEENGWHRPLLRYMRRQFDEQLVTCPGIYGVVRTGSGAQRMMRYLGAHFSPSAHPAFSRWDIRSS